MTRIKAPVMVGAVNKVEGDEERKDTEDRNDEHRGNVIDTVIVRIMKYVALPTLLPRQKQLC
jgi:cullin 3